jgi:t-SNARE complex subunit (syntaxin)
VASEHDRRRTPPGGTPIQTWDEEERTDINADPAKQLATRAKNAASASRAAFGAISEVRRELRESVKRDQEDHERIGSAMERMDSKVGNLEEKVDKVGEHVSDLREQSAATGAHVSRLITVVEGDQKARLQLTVIKETAEIEDTAHRKKWSRDIWLKIAAGVGPILAALGTYLATHC